MAGLRIAMLGRLDYCGLGTLSRTFAEFLSVDRCLALNFRPHRFNDSWLPADSRTAHRNQITRDTAEWLLEGADAVLTHETWYGPEVPVLARNRGVKTIKTVMYECQPLGGIADGMTFLAICPHELCLREVEVTPCLRDARNVQLSFPIDTARIPFRRRERAQTFVHFAKEGDRDGTPNVLAAWSLVKSDARLIVYIEDDPPRSLDSRVEFRHRCSADYYADYGDGDVLVHPHRWAGYSCVIHEALAAGMPVITTRFWPFCDGGPLPRATSHIEPDLRERYESDGPGLLPASSQVLAIEPTATRRHVICRPIIAFETAIEAIAAKVDELYDSEITAASQEGRAWAEQRSFDALRERWLEELAA